MKIISANITLLAVLITLGSGTYGQNKDSIPGLPDWYRVYKKTEIVVGINGQLNTKTNKGLTYAEIGIARSLHSGTRHGPVSAGVYLSEELYFGETNIYGTKLGGYMHWLFDLGLSTIFYTDGKMGNFKVRPEFGFGMAGFRAVFGYNIPTVRNKAFEELRRNSLQVSFQLMLGVKKKEITRKGSIIKDLFKKN